MLIDDWEHFQRCVVISTQMELMALNYRWNHKQTTQPWVVLLERINQLHIGKNAHFTTDQHLCLCLFSTYSDMDMCAGHIRLFRILWANKSAINNWLTRQKIRQYTYFLPLLVPLSLVSFQQRFFLARKINHSFLVQGLEINHKMARPLS